MAETQCGSGCCALSTQSQSKAKAQQPQRKSAGNGCLVKSVLFAFCDRIGDFGGGFITIDMAADHALVLHAASEHFLTQMLGLKRSGLDALNVALEGGFERCRREMAHGRMPLHFTEGEGNLVWRRFGVRRERHGDHHGGGEEFYLHSLFLLTTRPPALQAPWGF